MILGIASIPLACCYLGIPLGLTALITGWLGKQKADQGLAGNSGQALAGLICGAVGLLLGMVQLVLVALNVSWFANPLTSARRTPEGRPGVSGAPLARPVPPFVEPPDRACAATSSRGWFSPGHRRGRPAGRPAAAAGRAGPVGRPGADQAAGAGEPGWRRRRAAPRRPMTSSAASATCQPHRTDLGQPAAAERPTGRRRRRASSTPATGPASAAGTSSAATTRRPLGRGHRSNRRASRASRRPSRPGRHASATAPSPSTGPWGRPANSGRPAARRPTPRWCGPPCRCRPRTPARAGNWPTRP